MKSNMNPRTLLKPKSNEFMVYLFSELFSKLSKNKRMGDKVCILITFFAFQIIHRAKRYNAPAIPF